MKHDQPQLIDALAAEYVLGTLRGAARRRFERWQSAEWHIASRVRTWEGRLMPLALRLPPVAPSPEVWARIEERIRAADVARADAGRRAAARPGLRALAAALVLCAIFAGGYFAWRTTESLHLQTVATIKGEQGAAAWSIELDARRERILAAIDGKRTIADICRDANDRSVAREFFQQLWRWDQVVFDTSHA